MICPPPGKSGAGSLSRMSSSVARGVADDVRRRSGDLPQVVRRDARRKTDRNAERAVQQTKGHARRQELRFVELAVVVPDEIDRALVDLGEHQLGEARQPRLGVAVGRCGVAVARTKIALAVDQRVAHRERLRQMHHRVVGRAVAVRVVLAEHLTDVARALGKAVRTRLAHRVQNATLHGFQPVGDLGQGARLDRRHRVAEIGL